MESRTGTSETTVYRLSGDARVKLRLERMLNSEFTGTRRIQRAVSVEDHTALEYMKRSQTYVDGHYQIASSQINGQPSSPNNRAPAYNILDSLQRHLMHDRMMYQLYVSKMGEYITNEQAKLVLVLERQEGRTTIWHIPHHPVFLSTGLQHVTVN
ncbi:hypothetical protein P879_09448 [Paragonimus westermani]|uniref:Uncharacterized protein n=1 Tax=Paragonimus westermani TaxID=34504 RepID=A0A8T0DEA7_9TREM|nr:hypothetical protein P879_09448 [Paragonimus westermani]